MDTTTLTLRRPEDLVAIIPYRLGFRPRDSVVLLAMCGPRHRIGVISRIDLADIGHPRVGPRLLREMVEVMDADGADDVFVVLYSDQPRAELAADPLVRGALDNLRALTTWADPPGPWVVGPRTFGCWGDGQECAPSSRDVTELEEGEVAAAMVLHGAAVVADRADLGVPRTTDVGRRRAGTRAAREARRRLTRIRARCGGGAGRPGAAFGLLAATPAADQREMHEWREEQWRRWQRLVGRARRGAGLPAAELGQLAESLEDELVRDGVLCSLIRDLPALPDPQTAAQTLDLVMSPGREAPDPARVEPAAVVLRELVACAPRRAGALALGLLAWLAWWQTDGARADVLAQQALRIRPGTRMAQLVDQALAMRVPPGWVHVAGAGQVTARDVIR